MFKYIKVILFGWITIPHIFVYLISRNRKTISIDLDRWSCFTPFGRKLYPNEFLDSSVQLDLHYYRFGGSKMLVYRCLTLMFLLMSRQEYRNVFYLRNRIAKYFLLYLRPLSSLYINVPSCKFGAGTIIQHGFSTIITAEKVGLFCDIGQQVTVGFNKGGMPNIGNFVNISAGAKLAGPIKIGDHATLGMNASVVKDIPENAVVVPSAMRIFYK